MSPMSPLSPMSLRSPKSLRSRFARTVRRGSSGGFALGLLAAVIPPSAGAAAQLPAEPRVLEFTISDLDEDHLDFLTGWDRSTADLLESVSRGSTRFHRAFGLAPGVAPVLPGLTASVWLWLPASSTSPARSPREEASAPRRTGKRRSLPVRPAAGRWRGVPPPRPNGPRAAFPEPRRQPGALPSGVSSGAAGGASSRPPARIPTASAGRRRPLGLPPRPRAATPNGAPPRGAPERRAAPAPRPGSAAPPRASSAGPRGRAVPRPGGARRSR